MPAAHDPTDEALLAAHRAGDATAFEQLFARYQAPLGRHLGRMLNDAAATEDLVLETFLRLHRHAHRWREGTPIRPWVFTIARNLARNWLRSQRLRRWVPLTAVREAPAPAARARDEIRRRVAAAFAELPAAQRETCSLRLLGDLSVEEIARITRVSPGTVKSRLFYGLRRLRARLADLSRED